MFVDVMVWGVLPVLIVGLLGLYIAWVGEEPDPRVRRANRKRGMVKCWIGIGMLIMGAIMTYAVSSVAQRVASMTIAFTGLMVGGVAMMFYGGISLLTGREFRTAYS